jgi:Uncharacterized low-complexity proteins
LPAGYFGMDNIYRYFGLAALLISLIAPATFAQSGNQHKVLYTGILNRTSEDVNVPVMIGMVNISEGRLSGTQIGFFNQIAKNLSGTQFGFVNLLEGNSLGAQFGFVNLVKESSRGAQFGFVNMTGSDKTGAQFGCANITPENLNGAAFGVVNMHKEVNGTQIGVVNIAQKYKRGVPIGVFTWIREGGYQAVEVSSDIFHPYNIAIKTGIPKLYTTIIVAFSPDLDRSSGQGVGIGSIIDMGRKGWFFNPEANFVSTFNKKSESFVSIYPNFGFRLGSNISIVASPSVTWQFAQKGQTLLEPIYSLYINEFNSRNALYLGLHFGLRYAINQ